MASASCTIMFTFSPQITCGSFTEFYFKYKLLMINDDDDDDDDGGGGGGGGDDHDVSTVIK